MFFTVDIAVTGIQNGSRMLCQITGVLIGLPVFT